MNDYSDLTATELLKELHHFFMIDTTEDEYPGLWVQEKVNFDKHYWLDEDYKVELIKETLSMHPHQSANYRITLFQEGEPITLLDYDGVNKKIKIFRRGQWINRLYKYLYKKERYYLEQMAENPNFAIIEY